MYLDFLFLSAFTFMYEEGINISSAHLLGLYGVVL